VIAAVIALTLAACQSTPSVPPEPIIKTQIVEVPVPVRCNAKEQLGAEPDYADNDEAIRSTPFPNPMTEAELLANWFYHTKILTAGRLQRIQRDREKTAAIEAC
jgi:hypothetical protein